MKKLPELIALGIGMGVLSLAGAIAWQSVQNKAHPVVETEPAATMPLQSGMVPSRK